MGKISRHDSWQQYNKNNNVAWGKAKDNEDEKLSPTSGVVGTLKETPVTKAKEPVKAVEEVVTDVDEIIEDEVNNETSETLPLEAKKPKGFQKKV